MSKFTFVTLLTLGRAPLVLIGCACSLANLVVPSPKWVVAAAILLSLSAVTDLFDGALARKWGVASRFGALADPLMDKVFYLSTLPVATFIALWCEQTEHAAALLALDIVSLLRDQWVSFLRAVGSEFGADVRATWSGKIRTIIGFPSIVAIHAWLGASVLAVAAPAHEGLALPPVAIPLALEGIILVLTVWSCIAYTRHYAPYLRRSAARGAS